LRTLRAEALATVAGDEREPAVATPRAINASAHNFGTLIVVLFTTVILSVLRDRKKTQTD